MQTYKEKALERFQESIDEAMIDSELSATDIVDTIKKSIVENYAYFQKEADRLRDVFTELCIGNLEKEVENLNNEDDSEDSVFLNDSWTEFLNSEEKKNPIMIQKP